MRRRAHWGLAVTDYPLEKNERFQKLLQMVARMHREGIDLLASTDALMPYVFPGFSLHDELQLLVRAGLTPLAALQTATFNPARFLGRESTSGTIEKRKAADLVLLDANPLDDISHTRKIAAVIAQGRLFVRAALETMLSAVAAGALKPDPGAGSEGGK